MRCSTRARLGALTGAAILAAPVATLVAQKIPDATKDTARVVYDDDGLRLHSVDGRRQLKIRGLIDFDIRVVPSDTSDAPANALAIRRARFTFDANVNPWVAFRLSIDAFTPGVSPLVDAFADVTLNKHWWLRAGKQKTPYGLERYTPIGDNFFPERSITSYLTSSRDGGLLLTGEYGDGRYEGSVGVFNGIPDGTIGDNDVNDAKDGTLRLVLRPVIRKGGQGITIGYNGTTGIQRGTTTNTQLPKLLAPSLQPWFSYRESAGAIADGLRNRNGLYAAAHLGPWGSNVELFENVARVRRGTSRADVTTTGWLATADYVLSGELSTQNGVTPAKPFNPTTGDWGAFQAVARMSGVTVSNDAFPFYSDSTLSARRAQEIGIGLNWFFTRNTKAQLDLEQTAFVGGAPLGDRKTEQLALLRLQVYF